MTTIVGCAGTASPHPTAVKTASGTPATFAGTVAPGAPNDLRLRKSVVLASCAGDAKGWKARGTVTNPTASRHEFHVTVIFTSDDATDLAQGTVDIAVAPGDTARWSVTGEFTGRTSAHCVLGPVT